MAHGSSRSGAIRLGSQSQNDGVTLGAFKPSDAFGEYNKLAFVVKQAISKMQTATIVRIEACTNSGDNSPVGFVDVTPQVNQVDGSGNPTPHGRINNLPYLRMQGGANAVILDPQVGDLGIAVFASRDISKVKSTKAQANPGSLRTYNFSDGIYLGGLLNGVPTQYIRFSSEGIEIVSPTAIKLQAPNITLAGAVAQSGGDVTMSQKLTVAVDVLTGVEPISSHNHKHLVGTTPTSPPTL